MQSFEISRQKDGTIIKAEGSTRPALLVAALKGMSAAAGPEFAEPDDRRERTFAVSGADVPGLIKALLEKALADSVEMNVAFDEIRFDLAAADRLEGALTGLAVKSWSAPVKAITGVSEAAKGEDGLWRATIRLSN